APQAQTSGPTIGESASLVFLQGLVNLHGQGRGEIALQVQGGSGVGRFGRRARAKRRDPAPESIPPGARPAPPHGLTSSQTARMPQSLGAQQPSPSLPEQRGTPTLPPSMPRPPSAKVISSTRP